MTKRNLKTHYYRNQQETRCGKWVDEITGSPLNNDGSVHSSRVFDTLEGVTCKTCLKASGNTQAPEGACKLP